MLIKLGGSLITHKKDTHRIDRYLDQIDLYLSGKGSLSELTQKISDLMNYQRLNKIFQTLSLFLTKNPQRKLILVHGAGSIGHSLVLHLLKSHSDLQNVYPIIKLAVATQNQIIVSTAIRHGINAVSLPSHPLFTGNFTEKVSTERCDASNLRIFELLITETDAIPVFFGDVGHTPSGWKVFSGDIYPSALIRRLSMTCIDSAVFLTSVEGKPTGIYTKDPSFEDAKYIAHIEVEANKFTSYDSDGQLLTFSGEEIAGNFDVTEAMSGKLRNLIDLADGFTRCWVVGLEEFAKALNGEDVGTRILPKNPHQMCVAFLGTGDAFGSGGRKNISILAEIGTQGVLLDCGPHILSALKQSGRSTNDIDMVLISHFHGDHCSGVPFLLLEASILQKRTKPLIIVGPPKIKENITRLYSALYANVSKEELPFSCEFISILPSKRHEINGIIIKAYKMSHTPEAQAYRIDSNDISIAYSGDTGWTENLIPLVKDTQLAILECNSFDTELQIHLNFHQVSQLHSLTDRLALIHIGPEVLDRIPLSEAVSNIFFPLEGQEIKI